MSNLTKQEQAEIERKFFQFFKQHPELKMEANKNLLQQYCDDQMLSIAAPSGAESLEIALLSLGNRLARKPKEIPPPPAPVAPPPPVPMEEWSTKRLRSYLKHQAPQPTGSLAQRQEARPALPENYFGAHLVNAPNSEIHELINQYGRAKVLARLDGKSREK